MDILTFCSLSGVCYNLASQFLLRVPWDKILKDTALAGSKKVWSSRNAYALVLKEAQMAQEVYRYFRNTIRKIDQYQKQLGVSICSLDAAKTFLKDFERVLEMYDPNNVTLWQNNMAGESLRQHLQYYVTFMHSMMSNISLELQYVTMQLQTIQIETDADRKRQLADMLRTSCLARYGNVLDDIPIQQAEQEEPDEESFLDAAEEIA